MSALLLLTLLFGGCPEMLQGFAGMLMLFFQRLPVRLLTGQPFLQVFHLLSQLRIEDCFGRQVGFSCRLFRLLLCQTPLRLLKLDSKGFCFPSQFGDLLIALGE